MIQRLFISIFCLVSSAVTAFAGDETVIAVLSSRMAAYTEALKGVEKAFGRPIQTVFLSEQAPRIAGSVKVVVAIGGKAAMFGYPRTVRLVHCLSPGAPVDGDAYRHRPTRVEIIPSPEKVIGKFKELAPRMRRLAVIWTSETVGNYIAEAKGAVGVEILSHRLEDPADLPAYLRRVKSTADALWLLPDPVLISADNMATIRTFSWSNGIPFFAPTGAIAEQGAAAGVSSSFEEIGAAAGRAALAALAGQSTPATVYPDSMTLVINESSARKAGIEVTATEGINGERTTP